MMQRDTHLTFGEIYEDREALLADVEKIIDIALVEVTIQPLHLRFITPSCPISEWYADNSALDYHITQPEDHTSDLQYISVSYCWRHSQSLSDLPVIPDYRIRDPTSLDKTPHAVRCPPIIFHHAVQFARQYRCPYIWIDQECIHQDDPQDIEQHLQIMDRVYSESTYTAAMLSVGISSQSKVDALVDFVYGEWDYVKPVERPLAVETLVELTMDPWFRRTWAFQEKNCARRLYLLVPISPTVLKYQSPKHVVDGDLYIDGSLVQRHLSAAWLAIYDVAREIPLYHDQYPGTSNMDANPLDLYVNGTFYSDDISFEIAKMADVCDNLLVADRVSVIGNVHRFKWRLLSGRLNDGRFGLSVCLLALHVVNMHWGRSTEGRRRGFLKGKMERVMEWRFVEAARESLGYHSRYVAEYGLEVMNERFIYRRNSR
jgi:hypothetical protein